MINSGEVGEETYVIDINEFTRQHASVELRVYVTMR